MKKILLAAAWAVILAACGGGGGDGPAPSSTTQNPTPSPGTPAPTTPPPATPPPATAGSEGLYLGTSVRNNEQHLLVLGDGVVWAVNGQTVDSVLYVQGMLRGSGTYSGSTLSGNLEFFNIWVGREQLAFSATFASGAVNWTMGTATPSTLAKSSAYDYNRAADPAELAGTWTGKTMDGAGTRVTISASGELAGTSSGCAFTGSAVPQSGGKNVFAVNFTTVQTPACDFLTGGTWWTLQNEPVSGIAVTYPLANGERQIIVGVKNSQSTYLGAGFVATNAPSAAPPPVVQVAQPLGLHVGRTSFGDDIRVMNLENGVVWGVASRTVNSVRQVKGLFRTTDGLYEFPTYLTFGMDFGRSYAGAGAVTRIFAAGFFDADDFNALVGDEPGAGTFTLIAKRSNDYEYNRAADLTALAGTWTGAALDGSAATITISAGGGVTGSSGGCGLTGAVSPRAGGKNVFDLSLTLGGSACARPGAVATGFAIAYPGATGQDAVLAVETAARDFGAAFLLAR